MRSITCRFIFLLALSAFASSASAVDYYWKTTSSSFTTQFPDPITACKAWVNHINTTGTPIDFATYKSISFYNSYQAKCTYSNRRIVDNYPMADQSTTLNRFGTTCTLPAVLDPATNSCKSPDPLEGTVCFDESVTPPRVMQGGTCINLNSAKPETQCKYFAGSGGVRSFWMYETAGGPPQAQAMQNKDGCEVSTAEGFKPETDCKYFPPTPAVPYFSEGVLVPGTAQPGAYKCKASTVLTGNYTAPSNGNGQKPADTICADSGSPACTLKELEKKKEQKPCTYTTDSQGNQVCVSSVFEASEGKTKCGFVGSEFKCSEDLNKAVGEGISIATKVETKPQPDGKTKITKTDVQTATSCKGSSCTTKTTTTTTTTIKDGTGATESVSGTCTGDNCPDKNGNPDGDGDGFGDCTGDDCGGGDGGPFELPEFEEVGTIAESASAFIDRVEDSPILSSISAIGLNGQGSCSMGSTTTTIGTISASSMCENSHWLDPLYFIFLAIHALAAVRVFLSA